MKNQKTEVIAYCGKDGRILFTFPDQYGEGIYTVKEALARNNVVLYDDDTDSRTEGFISKVTANQLAGVKLGGSKWIYTDWIDMEKSTKDIPAALQKVQAELPFPAEVVLL